MSSNPTGPWEYKSHIMDPNRRFSGNHPGIIGYKGNSYVFGFNFTLRMFITNGDFIKVRGVEFGGRQVSNFTASVASASNGGSIELHLDSVDGPKIGSLPVSSTGGWNTWQTRTTTVSGATGTHDLYFLFRGDVTGQLFNFDYWKFNEKCVKHPKS